MISKVHNAPSLLLALALYLLPFSFLQANPDRDFNNGSLPSIEISELIDKLRTPVGSESRTEIGQRLFEFFNQYFQSKGLSYYEENDQEQRVLNELGLTRRLMLYTAMYLQQSENDLCAPEEKIRLYRGALGGLIRPEATPKNSGVALSGFGLSLFEERFEGDIGIAAYQKLKENSFDFNSVVKWDRIFHFEERQENNEEPLSQGKLFPLLVNHNTASHNTPFISLTTSPQVAKEFSSRAVLVLDLCPERISFMKYNMPHYNFYESEIVVPLFLLPEEITRVVPVDEFNAEEFSLAQKNTVTATVHDVFFEEDFVRGMQIIKNRFFTPLRKLDFSHSLLWRAELLRWLNNGNAPL